MKDYGRNVVQPISDPRDLENCIVYLTNRRDYSTSEYQRRIADRNLMMFRTGINTALRISDILRLKSLDVKTGYIQLREKKTNKINQITVSNKLKKYLQEYIARNNLKSTDYLFFSSKSVNKPITREQAWYILQDLKKELKLKYPVGTHTMRKTFGYYYYKETKNIVMLQKMLNHTSRDNTLIYIGILQNDVNKERKGFTIGL